CPQLLNPRACRSALCFRTAVSKPVREMSCKICEKMLHTRFKAESSSDSLVFSNSTYQRLSAFFFPATLSTAELIWTRMIRDIQQYQSVEAARRHFKDKSWRILQRAYVHYENDNLDLLRKEAETISKSVPDLGDKEKRGGWLMSMTRFFFDFFVVDPTLAEQIERSVALAMRADEKELRDLATEYVKSGRMAALWKEIKSVRRQFLILYESMLPLLMVRRYWHQDKQDISDYELSVKNFEDLKGFYIDCVETSFRLLVVGLGVELIANTGKPVIKARTGDKAIWWFEQVANGIKDTQLKQFPLFDLITPALDLGLRNGVGHNSAHYDVTSDSIIYVKADDANLNEVRLPYTAFVDKVFKAYCAFELATGFFQWLFVAGGGKL
ncbi:MAG TPA: hypothetical protein VFC29_03385, partial [Candidatus Limnocylindrales bacterium]|nr:hypothetical protein [Candidatus Limnocylindrales bacterium]